LNPEFQQNAAKIAIEENKRVANLIGIKSAARITTTKPSGTASLLLGGVGSGIHPHHASRYIRRVTANELEPVFQHFKSKNPHMCVKKPNGDWVIEFPIQSKDGSILKENVSAVEFLNIVKLTQENWVMTGTARPESSPGLTHNVSNTVMVGPEEWDEVMEFVWENKDIFSGISFIPKTGDKDYAFAPLEAIKTEADEEKWNHLIKHYQPVDYSAMIEEDDSTSLKDNVACSGGACELI
jgi:ribonucleoside-diphosphate reductase alpha chain